jgi:glycogen debranching enzyme
MTQSSVPPASADEDRYHVVASASLGSEGLRVLKHGDTFIVLDRFGDIRQGERGELGVYHRGTKHVSRLGLRIQRRRPLLLSSSMLQNNLVLNVDLTIPDLFDAQHQLVIPSGTLHVARSKFVLEGMYFEHVKLTNYGERPVAFELSFDHAADFVDIFEVRGTRRERRGQALPPEVEPSALVFGYVGLDAIVRRTRFEFQPAPERLDAERAVYDVRLESRESREVYVRVACVSDAREPAQAFPSFEAALSRASENVRAREGKHTQIHTSNDQFNEWLERSESDLGMLVTETPSGDYPYAGVPWFSTPFGRDGIWTALEALWVQPELARGVLRFLALHQATRLDADSDAEPGKILHEMREGEMAALREIPFGRYYGSIDSTPLYLMLAAKYYRASGDRELIESIWPSLLAASEWISHFGDLDADGFVEYGKRSKDGLVQQGWKDSNDSVFHRDGSLAEGPIALAEVQGYVYAALLGMGDLGRAVGEAELAARWEDGASALKQRFDDKFWCEGLATYALALDKHKQACRVRSSNAGHCLYTGIAMKHRAPHLAAQLMSTEMYSGWGIRTLASDERRYNPMAYHNGSIWPHDTAIVAAGLAEYGYKQEAGQLLTCMFDAARFMELGRLPELFCGFPRVPGQAPTLYPVACAPQAWASAAVFLLLRATLGLEIDAVEQRVTFRHALLPSFLDEMEIKNLRVGAAEVDLHLQRHPDDVGINVLRKSGKVEVVAVK